MSSATQIVTEKPKFSHFIFLPPGQVFRGGAPGVYAVRYYSNPGNIRSNYAIRRLMHNERAVRNANELCPDLLSYFAKQKTGKSLRQWLTLQHHQKKAESFRICSYNVLCQATLEEMKHLYGRSPKDTLHWNHRSQGFSYELPALEADIFCLQEVQKEHYHNFFAPLLMEHGFEGHYLQKTGEKREGCAIFYRRAVFEELDYRHVDLFASEDSTLDKPNVAQLIRLRHIHSKKEICIANTHLVFNKKYGAKKFAQTALILAHLRSFIQKGRPAEYLLCGDFNIEPFSDVYRFILEGRLDLQQCVDVLMSGQGGQLRKEPTPPQMDIPEAMALKQDCTLAKKGEKFAYEGSAWSHQQRFASAYHHVRLDRTRDLSTYHTKEGMNPDFIFYSVASTKLDRSVLQVKEAGLRLVRRLELPDISEANATFGPWPHAYTPSDHVPLLVDFAFV